MSGFKRVLKKKGITQRQLAKEVGMSYQMICMYATGKVDMGSKKLFKIARQLAKEVGMSYQMICMYATGKVDMGSKKLYKIAKYLNVPMEELIEEEECESRTVI